MWRRKRKKSFPKGKEEVMDREPKTSSLIVKATQRDKDTHFSGLMEKIPWVISLPIQPITFNQFMELMALIGMVFCLQTFMDWAYPYIQKMFIYIKKLLRHDKDK